MLKRVEIDAQQKCTYSPLERSPMLIQDLECLESMDELNMIGGDRTQNNSLDFFLADGVLTLKKEGITLFEGEVGSPQQISFSVEGIPFLYSSVSTTNINGVIKTQYILSTRPLQSPPFGFNFRPGFFADLF